MPKPCKLCKESECSCPYPLVILLALAALAGILIYLYRSANNQGFPEDEWFEFEQFDSSRL